MTDIFTPPLIFTYPHRDLPVLALLFAAPPNIPSLLKGVEKLFAVLASHGISNEETRIIVQYTTCRNTNRTGSLT
jgi:hypothetical protein